MTTESAVLTGLDPRTLSPHHGYLMSVLASPRLADPAGRAMSLSDVLFDEESVGRLVRSVASQMSGRRGLFDMMRFANPLRAPDEAWRRAKKLDDLLDDQEFAEHVQDILIRADRLSKGSRKAVSATDIFGQPTALVVRSVLMALVDLEQQYAPPWARLGLQNVPVGAAPPRGVVLSNSLAPVGASASFAYLGRLYDLDRAIDVLPEQHVRAFCDEVLKRAVSGGLNLPREDVTLMAAAAEALASGIYDVERALDYIRTAMSRRRIRAAAGALAVGAPPGLIEQVRRRIAAIIGKPFEISGDPLKEASLQFRIHPDEPDTVAKILIALFHPRYADDDGLVQSGPLVMNKSLMRAIGLEEEEQE